MSKYNEEQIAGSKWTRCHKIEITNRLEGVKKATFYEQEAIVISNTEIVYKNLGPGYAFYSPINVVFDANTVIDVVDPVTLQPTGQTFTHGELYVMLFSAYMDAARKRDEEVEAQANTQTTTGGSGVSGFSGDSGYSGQANT